MFSENRYEYILPSIKEFCSERHLISFEVRQKLLHLSTINITICLSFNLIFAELISNEIISVNFLQLSEFFLKVLDLENRVVFTPCGLFHGVASIKCLKA